MLEVKQDLIKKVTEMDVIINRLYSFNYFLKPEEVTLLRNVHEKIHRYIPYIQLEVGKDGLLPINPSISFMTESLLELQDDFRKFRTIIFKNNLKERDFLIIKILRAFNIGGYKDCIKGCKLGIKLFPSDSSLYNLFLVRCYYLTNKKKIAYQLLSDYLLVNNDLTSNRNNLYPLLQEPMIEDLIIKRTNTVALNNMKQIVQGEKLDFENFLSNNEKLKKYFADKIAITLG